MDRIYMRSIVRASCVGFVFCISSLAESSANMQLVVQIRSEAVLAWQGDGAVLAKIRLGPGIQAGVWADDSCGTPSVNGHVIAASGTYTIPLGELDGSGKANVCISSSDASIRSFLPVLGK
jgi:hypothetical protein